MNYNYWLLIGSTTLGLAGLITAKTRQLKWFAGGAVMFFASAILFSCGSVTAVENDFAEFCERRGGYVVASQLESRCFSGYGV